MQPLKYCDILHTYTIELTHACAFSLVVLHISIYGRRQNTDFHLIRTYQNAHNTISGEVRYTCSFAFWQMCGFPPTITNNITLTDLYLSFHTPVNGWRTGSKSPGLVWFIHREDLYRLWLLVSAKWKVKITSAHITIHPCGECPFSRALNRDGFW